MAIRLTPDRQSKLRFNILLLHMYSMLFSIIYIMRMMGMENLAAIPNADPSSRIQPPPAYGSPSSAVRTTAAITVA
jgi:hypothetical protein